MPYSPYIIYGTVFESDASTPDAGASLTLTNKTTIETLSGTTNVSGQFIFDLANLTSGYTDGDYIVVSVNESGNNGQDLRIRIDANGIGQIEEIRVEYTHN